jgi:hypothetical protein
VSIASRGATACVSGARENACEDRRMDTARDLSAKLASLLRNEQHTMADFLVALVDFDARKLWRDLGHASLFSYLRRELGLSAGAAQYRKTAAELIQKLPEVEPALRQGRLCLSTVAEVAKVVTAENVGELLPRFFGLSRKEAEALAVSIRPVACPPVRAVVTVVQAPVPPVAPSLARGELGEVRPGEPLVPDRSVRPGELPLAAAGSVRPGEVPAPTAPVPSPAAAPAPVPRRDEAKPLSHDTARLHITVSHRFLEKLERARDALSHAKPGASVEEILEAGLDLLLEKNAKRHGQVKRPRTAQQSTPNASATPRTNEAVPAHVKREVWKRAGGRCEWKLASGERCGSTIRLEYDHIAPRALGGPSTIENIRLCCRAHNDLAARQVFGDAWMDRFRRGGTSSA